MTAVKICGITDTGTLERMLELPVDYIGLVFAPSKRQVSLSQAGQLTGYLREEAAGFPLASARSVGVFVNPEPSFLEEVFRVSPLDVVQLHGQESPDFCRWVADTFGVEVIKALSLPGFEEEQTEQESLAGSISRYEGAVSSILLDTYDPVHGGGSGKSFAWNRIPEAMGAAREAGLTLLVAGGLSPDNVQQLITSYAPDGVDISSGVETEGRKDTAKIRRFVERVKQA